MDGALIIKGSTTANPGLTIEGNRANLVFKNTGATGGVA